MSVRIILADDHSMMRDGLRAILDKEGDFEVVGEAKTGREAITLATTQSPDVVVMDIGMPDLNGVEATREIIDTVTNVKVIALSTYSDRQFVLEMLDAGAASYVLKSTASEELLLAIRTVMDDKTYLSPEVAAGVVSQYVDRLESAADASPLGTREREILQLVAEGKKSRQIASQLHVSVNTVETHRKNIMRKLDLHTIADLTKFAVRHGMTTP